MNTVWNPLQEVEIRRLTKTIADVKSTLETLTSALTGTGTSSGIRKLHVEQDISVRDGELHFGTDTVRPTRVSQHGFIVRRQWSKVSCIDVANENGYGPLNTDVVGQHIRGWTASRKGYGTNRGGHWEHDLHGVGTYAYPWVLGDVYGIGDIVFGTDWSKWSCILGHTASAADKPITGANYRTYWELVAGDGLVLTGEGFSSQVNVRGGNYQNAYGGGGVCMIGAGATWYGNPDVWADATDYVIGNFVVDWPTGAYHRPFTDTLFHCFVAHTSSVATRPLAAWVASHYYSVGRYVEYLTDGHAYVCATAHTSGTFATDLAAGKWVDMGASTWRTKWRFAESANVTGQAAGSYASLMRGDITPSHQGRLTAHLAQTYSTGSGQTSDTFSIQTLRSIVPTFTPEWWRAGKDYQVNERRTNAAPAWATETWYVAGTRISNDGLEYTAVSDHWSSVSSEPPNVTYWTKVGLRLEYICILGHTSALGVNDPPNVTYWRPIKYDPLVTYAVGDIVLYGPGTWQCIKNAPGMAPLGGGYADYWVFVRDPGTKPEHVWVLGDEYGPLSQGYGDTTQLKMGANGYWPTWWGGIHSLIGEEDYKGYKDQWVTGTVYTGSTSIVRNGTVEYIARTNHTAGATSEPGVGATWTTYWQVYDRAQTVTLADRWIPYGTLEEVPFNFCPDSDFIYPRLRATAVNGDVSFGIGNVGDFGTGVDTTGSATLRFRLRDVSLSAVPLDSAWVRCQREDDHRSALYRLARLSFFTQGTPIVGGTALSLHERMRISSAGTIGIFGNAAAFAPTAALHLPAGTATASSAPLKLTAGTNLTTPEDGALEFDGTHLYFTIGATRHTLV